MTRKYKPLVFGLIVAVFVACLPLSGFAADGAPAASKVFEGFTLTVLDQTTPAANMRGRQGDPNVMCFISAAEKEIGSMSYRDYLAVIEKNKKVVALVGGGTLATPPDGRSNWSEWFADEFNKHRGLGAENRAEAVVSDTTETVEAYRQELVRLVNLEREKAGLPAYIINDECMEYSKTRAEELATQYSHTRPDGTNAGYEIICMGPISPEGAVSGWMNSPGHKAAILNENRVYVGAGCHINSNGTILWQMYFERDPEVYANTLILG